MDENDVSYRVPCILVGCLLLDVILFVRYVWEPEDALIYLTSWSHLFSFFVRSRLLYECFFSSTKDNTIPKSVWNVRFFHLSSILLYTILVTFFVVLVLDDTIMCKRLDAFELPHYQYIDPDGTILSRYTYDNRPYFEEMRINEFHSLGKMVAYNNIRHVFPAVVHLVLTYELRTTQLAVTIDSPRDYVCAICVSLILPFCHWLMALKSFDNGERDIYDCDPTIPAFAMLFSILVFVFLQLNLVKSTNNKSIDEGRHNNNDTPPIAYFSKI